MLEVCSTEMELLVLFHNFSLCCMNERVLECTEWAMSNSKYDGVSNLFATSLK